MKYDLHAHSYYSDGQLSPAQLIQLAVDNQITHLALTDHDTVAGLASAQQAADKTQLKLINGVELSCTWRHQLLHIVALNIDPENEILLAGVASNTQQRLDRAEAMFVDFEKHDIELRDSVKKILGKHSVPTRPHFAQALIDKGLAKNKQQAFKRYLTPGKIGYVAMQWPELEQIAEWVNRAGGVAVLAHPMRYKFTRTKLIKLIEDMQAVGINGIEVSTAVTDKQQMTTLSQLALEYDLLASTGSDFHSHDQPWARLGSAAELPENLNYVWNHF